MALSFGVIFGFVGMAIDIGYIQTTRRQLQTAADAAAMAGAQEILAQASNSVISAAAQDSATQNGFTNGANGVVVTVNNPPLNGPNTGNSNAVEVIVTKKQANIFMGMIGATNFTVGARAVGMLGASPACIQTTGPVGEGIDIDGGFILTTNGCGVTIGSVCTGNKSDPAGCSEQALTTHGGDCKGGGGTTPGTGTPMVVAKKVSVNASSFAQGTCTSPAVTFDAPPVVDMLKYLPQPSVGTCLAGHTTLTKITTSTTLQPGTYCGGIWITNNSTVTLTGGTYILYGGSTMADGRHSLEVDGGSTLKDNGAGVTFFNTGSTSPYNASNPIPQSDWASFELCTGAGPNPACKTSNTVGQAASSTEATVNLSAPTSGTYAGILFFDARTLSNSNSAFGTTDQFAPCGGTNATHEDCAKKTTQMFSFAGGANQQFTGTFYLPTTLLWYTGCVGCTTSKYSPFVGWILLWNMPGGQALKGGLTVNSDYTGVSGGNPLKSARLGE